MELIIFQDGLYYLFPVTLEMVAGETWKDCFDLCEIIRNKISTYQENINSWLIGENTFFFGCICK